MSMSHKSYLGDGAYVEFDGFSVHLTTEDGISTTNRVVLEPHGIRNFEEWLDRLRSELDTPGPEECSTCEGSGLFSKADRESDAIPCDDCNGRGTK